MSDRMMCTATRLLGFVILAVGIGAPAAVAAQAAEAAMRWGLIGTWKIDCAAPASVGNSQYVFVVREGRLVLDRDLNTEADTNPITRAEIRKDGSLLLVLQFPRFKQRRENVLAKSPDGGRLKIVLNRNLDTNEYSVRDETFTQTGQRVPWFTRCGADSVHGPSPGPVSGA